MVGTLGDPGRLRLLMDSNVFIAVEPYAGHLEEQFTDAARLVRLANELGHILCIAPATRDDLLQGKDPDRRRQRLAELSKFQILDEVPISADLEARAGISAAGTNDARDLRILAAVDAGAVTYLVTGDIRLRKRAKRAGLSDSVLSLADAVALLAAFRPDEALPPPRVLRPKTYTLRTDDPIFDGLRADYPGFDDWLSKVRRESDTRTCFVIEEDGRYAALALLKPESDAPYGMKAPATKISTFKVADDYSGLKFGELLLKAILSELATDPPASLFVEVLPSHPEVVGFLGDFGFTDSGNRNSRGEMVLVKRLIVGDDDLSTLSDLDFHVKYGPPALLCRQSVYVVPIEPRWHDQLFPEQIEPTVGLQLPLLFDGVPPTHPWGNALRKAYLCHSPTTTIASGDVLLFYRSKDRQSVSAVGVVEDILRSADPHQVIKFVGRRTVYTPEEIVAMARRAKGVLAIRFRQDRFLAPPLAPSDLQAMGALKSWPQSIVQLPAQALSRLRSLLVE